LRGKSSDDKNLSIDLCLSQHDLASGGVDSDEAGETLVQRSELVGAHSRRSSTSWTAPSWNRNSETIRSIPLLLAKMAMQGALALRLPLLSNSDISALAK
jgi:hypothetical protein